MRCPDCGSENISGNDSCEQCGQPLSGLFPLISSLEEDLLQTRIGDLDLRSPICIPQHVSAHTAIQAMHYYQFGCLLIVQQEKLVGIVTEWDVLALSTTGESHEQPVHQWMTRHPETCTPADSLAFVVRTMDEGGYRHLPVVQSGRPVAIISSRDILQFVSRQFPEDSSWMERLQ